MKPSIFSICSAVSLATAPAAVAGLHAQAMPAEEMRETKDRLSPEEMSELVAAPMAIVESRGMAAGIEAFDRLLAATRAAHGDESVEVADLLMAFGVTLYIFGMEPDDRRIQRQSLTYLAAAIPAYRAAFGDAHPEVAVALNSHADVEIALHADNPPESVATALQEAYRIRRNALGPTHVETLATLRSLATLRGHPSRTRGNRARIAEAAGLFRQLIAVSSSDPEQGPESSPYAYAALARMYARNGLAGEARAELRRAAAEAAGWDEPDRCVFVVLETTQIEELLAEKNPRLAAAQQSGFDALLGCVGFERVFWPDDNEDG